MTTEPLYLSRRTDWRAWLAANFDTAKEAWLVYPRKATGRPRVAYNDAIEEALCFGWIDSTQKRLDDAHTMQRFTPRRSGSRYSQANRERLRWLLAEGLIHPTMEEEVAGVLAVPFVFPDDILKAIRDDSEAWNHYQRFSDGYRRIRIAYIDSARKRPEEFEKRLANFIAKTREGVLIKGYGGIEKHY